MRKTLVTLLSLCLVFVFAFSAAADVIWEPYGDSFYDSHTDELTYEGRAYKATHDLYFYKKPDGKQLNLDPVYAGDVFYVQYVYEDKDGVLWGNYAHRETETAWLDLSGCIRLYNREDFDNHYYESFETLNAQPDAAFYSDAEVWLYEYPGADTALYELYVDENASYLPEYAHTYTDANGNIWGELQYYMGQKGWVLLEGDIGTAVKPDKAEDTLIPAREGSDTTAGEDEKSQTDENNTLQDPSHSDDRNVIGGDNVQQENEDRVLLPALLVGAVVAVSLLLLFLFFRKKKNK